MLCHRASRPTAAGRMVIPAIQLLAERSGGFARVPEVWLFTGFSKTPLVHIASSTSKLSHLVYVFFSRRFSTHSTIDVAVMQLKTQHDGITILPRSWSFAVALDVRLVIGCATLCKSGRVYRGCWCVYTLLQ
jgi:hypothetical protein